MEVLKINDMKSILMGEESDLVIKYETDNYPIRDWQLNENNCYIYLLYNYWTKLYKIGKTINLRTRLKAISSASGVMAFPIAWIELGGGDEKAEIVECYLHKYYKLQRKSGEWFDLSIEQVQDIINLFYFIFGEEMFNYCDAVELPEDIEDKIESSNCNYVDWIHDENVLILYKEQMQKGIIGARIS